MSHHLDTNTIYTFATFFFRHVPVCLSGGGVRGREGRREGLKEKDIFSFFPSLALPFILKWFQAYRKFAKVVSRIPVFSSPRFPKY